MTKKQQKEIDYLRTWTKLEITNEHIEEYIQATVHGKGKSGKFSTNPIIQAQQRLGITTSFWKEDMVSGIVSYEELIEDATCDYERELITSIRDSVTAKYRANVLKLYKNLQHPCPLMALAFTNFPEIMEKIKKQ